MARSDYERPAWYQINTLYRCQRCGTEQDVRAGESARMPCPACHGFVVKIGESYPGRANDWDEERDSVNDEWRQKR
jgi:DNA-directed RNA polymerase subunit RPC12/RpoP